MTHFHENILSTLETEMARFDPFPIERASGDQWLLASAMQKAIRRGDQQTSFRVGHTLWQMDRQRFWRRLHIIAMEDVGVADTEALIQTLTATAHPYWRRKMDDSRVGLYLIQLLCRSVKIRIADSLFSQAERCPRYMAQRQDFAQRQPDDLASIVTDPTAPLVERALAIWYLAGTKKYPSEHLPVRAGDVDSAIASLYALEVPEGLVEACIGVMSRTPWPLAVMTPLIWQYVESQRKQAFIHKDTIAPIPSVGGIPLYALDMFTRTGQASFRQWQKAVPDLGYFSIRQIGHAVFYEESHLIDQRLSTPAINEFMEAGQWVDAESTGLCLPEYFALRDLVREHMSILQEIRTRQLRKAIEEGRL